MTLNQSQMESVAAAKHQHETGDFVLSKADLQQKYDALAPTYRNWNWIDEYLFGTRRLRRQLLRQASGTILDVACGTGENFAFLPQSSRITAVDLSPGMLALAAQRAQKLGRTIDTQVMDATALDFADDSFDTVVSALSTCTFPDPVATLQEMKRVCRADGRILLLEHGRSRVGWVGRYQDRKAHNHFQTAGCRWNQEPQELVQAAGLQILSARRAFFGVFHGLIVSPN